MTGGGETLHGWIYQRVQEVCWDREYLYRSFVDHFAALMTRLYDTGSVSRGGEHVITGLKSGLSAVVRWQLARQVSFQGPNLLRVEAVYRDEDGRETGRVRAALFDLSSGEEASP